MFGKQIKHAITVLRGEWNPMPLAGMNLREVKRVLNDKQSKDGKDQGNRPDSN